MNNNTRFAKRKAATKQKIYETAVNLFTKNGYDETSIEEICEKADIAKRTFFNHFPTKAAVLAYLSEKRLTFLNESITHTLSKSDNAAQKLLTIINVLGQLNEEEREITGLALAQFFKTGSQDLSPELFNQYTFRMELIGLIDEGKGSGLFRSDIDSGTAADIVIGVYFSTLFQWTSTKLEKPLTSELSQRIQIILQGLKP